MKESVALEFCQSWLPAWTGNNPNFLIQFYSDDAYYQDPGNPEGIRGKENLLHYFEKLLKKYPDWIWTPLEIFSINNGFILKWQATIVTKVISGLDIVELQDSRINRNEVYFDPRHLFNPGK